MSELLTIGEPMALFAAQDPDVELKDAVSYTHLTLPTN
mgnify:CR=1 FL=1